MPVGAARPDPMVLRCPYPDMLRGDPRCEAPGTTSALCQPRGGARPGETWKAEQREGSQVSSLRSGQKRLTGRSQKGDVGRTVRPVSAGGSTRMSHWAIGPSLPTTRLDLDQLGKPHGPRPAKGGIPTARRGMGQGVEDAGESERRPVIGRIGRCPSRKGADFRRVSPTAMPLPSRTC